MAVLPVKAPRNAKQRLAQVLGAEQREELARLLFRQTLATLCSARGLDAVAVATSDAGIAAHARRAGVIVFEEERQLGHSHSADAAARRAKALGAATVLLVPIDVPLLVPAEIDALAAAAHPGVIIVPSSDGTGTNALVRTPPDVIESRFGPGSFLKHLDQARQSGVRVSIRRPPGLVFDLDTSEDAAELLERAPGCPAALLLAHRCASKSRA